MKLSLAVRILAATALAVTTTTKFADARGIKGGVADRTHHHRSTQEAEEEDLKAAAAAHEHAAANYEMAAQEYEAASAADWRGRSGGSGNSANGNAFGVGGPGSANGNAFGVGGPGSANGNAFGVGGAGSANDEASDNIVEYLGSDSAANGGDSGSSSNERCQTHSKCVNLVGSATIEGVHDPHHYSDCLNGCRTTRHPFFQIVGGICTCFDGCSETEYGLDAALFDVTGDCHHLPDYKICRRGFFCSSPGTRNKILGRLPVDDCWDECEREGYDFFDNKDGTCTCYEKCATDAFGETNIYATDFNSGCEVDEWVYQPPWVYQAP